MTMTPAEIAADYRQAKTKTKQITILADLNSCSKDEIKEILLQQGEKLPGNCSAPSQRKAKPNSDTPHELVPAKQGAITENDDDTIPASEAIPFVVRMAAIDVIDKFLKESEAGDDPEIDSAVFRDRVHGVLEVVHEVERKSEEIENEDDMQ